MLVALAHAVLLHRDGLEGQDLAARLERASQARWLPACRSMSVVLACALIQLPPHRHEWRSHPAHHAILTFDMMQLGAEFAAGLDVLM